MQSNTKRHALFNTGQSMPVLAHLAITMAVYLTAWDHRRRSRLTLQGLDDHMLRDIGLTQSTAQTEVDKPFWKG